MSARFNVQMVVCTINGALNLVDSSSDWVGWVELIALNGCTFRNLKGLGHLMVP